MLAQGHYYTFSTVATPFHAVLLKETRNDGNPTEIFVMLNRVDLKDELISHNLMYMEHPILNGPCGILLYYYMLGYIAGKIILKGVIFGDIDGISGG